MTSTRKHVSTPAELRALIAAEEWTTTTAGLLSGRQQANLAIVPHAQAFEFLLYCVRNPKACPIISVLEPGNPEIVLGSTRADVRNALPRYRVWENGQLVAEPHDIEQYWRDDAVAFLLGCSHTFEGPLEQAGLDFRRNPESAAPPAYITNIPTVPVGSMGGPLVVSMRAFPAADVPRVVEVTSRYPKGHGSPIHIGDPTAIGIADVLVPDFGPAPTVAEGEVPVFWACGVTPQMVLPKLDSAYVISHYPGHMFVFDHHVDEEPQQVHTASTIGAAS